MVKTQQVEWQVYNNQGHVMKNGFGAEVSLIDFMSGNYVLSVNGKVYKIIKQ